MQLSKTQLSTSQLSKIQLSKTQLSSIQHSKTQLHPPLGRTLWQSERRGYTSVAGKVLEHMGGPGLGRTLQSLVEVVTSDVTTLQSLLAAIPSIMVGVVTSDVTTLQPLRRGQGVVAPESTTCGSLGARRSRLRLWTQRQQPLGACPRKSRETGLNLSLLGS